MKIQYDPHFITQLKRLNIRTRKSFKKKIKIFELDKMHPELKNHELKSPYEGLRSMNITNDYRAIYEQLEQRDYGMLVYFLLIGTHNELYKN
jgi:addiction module RelE/StbE family toxin